MPEFEELKIVMLGIADVLKQYPEPLQSKVFDILVSNYMGLSPAPQQRVTFDSPISEDTPTKVEPVNIQAKPAQPTSTPRKRQVNKDSFQMVKDLDLWGNGGTQNFKDFSDSKTPTSNIEFNVVAVYYLKHILRLPAVGLDHVYTCYKAVNRPLPTNLKSSLYDTSSSRYGYINAADMNDLKIPPRGENFVEHELPKKVKASK